MKPIVAIKPIRPIKPLKPIRTMKAPKNRLPVATCEIYTEGVVMVCPLCGLPVKGHHACRKESK